MELSKKEYLYVTYFICKAMFLGIGFSYIFRFSGNDSYISIILGYLIGNVFIIFFDKVSKNVGYNINSFFNRCNLVSNFYKVVFIFLYLFTIIYASNIFTNFVKTYYLFNTPLLFTMSVLLFVCFTAASKGENTIIRLCTILFYISIVITIINFLFLAPLVEVNNFLPIYMHKTCNVLKGSLIYAIFSSFPNILLLEYKVPLKTRIKSYTFISAIILLMNITVTGVLGEFLISSYSYPEYMVLRRIRFLDIIENIENFAATVLYFDAFIIISLAICKLRKIFYKDKTKNYIVPIILVLIVIISNYLFTNYFVFLSNFFKSGIIIYGVLLLLIGPILAIVTSNKKITNKK